MNGGANGCVANVPAEVKLAIRRALTQRLARACAEQGKGTFDLPITEQETTNVRQDLDNSLAMPPDLLPKAAFRCGATGWDQSVWRVQ